MLPAPPGGTGYSLVEQHSLRHLWTDPGFEDRWTRLVPTSDRIVNTIGDKYISLAQTFTICHYFLMQKYRNKLN